MELYNVAKQIVEEYLKSTDVAVLSNDSTSNTKELEIRNVIQYSLGDHSEYLMITDKHDAYYRVTYDADADKWKLIVYTQTESIDLSEDEIKELLQQ